MQFIYIFSDLVTFSFIIIIIRTGYSNWNQKEHKLLLDVYLGTEPLKKRHFLGEA